MSTRLLVPAAALTLVASVLVAGPVLSATPAVAADWTVHTIEEFEDAIAADPRGTAGAGSVTSGATLTVTGGAVAAYATAGNSAIGGAGYGGSGGVVNVTGGSLYAESTSAYATVIGSAGGVGDSPVGDAGTVTVTGGTLTAATTSSSATAIGGGNRLGSPQDGDFGSLTVDGTLYLPSGRMIVKDSLSGPEVTVGATGRILGDPTEPTTGATFTGTGQISNAGVIALAPPPAMVDGNNRLVTFDTGDVDVRVFAPSFDEGYRTLPAPPVGTDWNTAADYTGAWFTGATSTAGSGTTALYAAPLGTLDVSSDPADRTATAGQPYSFPTSVLDHAGVPLSPQPVVDHTSPDCTITDGDVFETVGDCTIIATTTAMVAPRTTSFTIHVVAGPVHAMAVTPSATSVAQGESLTFTVTGEDAYGNPVDTAAAVLTSSVSTDVISGHTVTFPYASPHTITATLDGVTSQTTIEVIADATALPQTGADTGSLTALGLSGLVLLTAGGVLLVGRLRRKTDAAVLGQAGS